MNWGPSLEVKGAFAASSVPTNLVVAGYFYRPQGKDLELLAPRWGCNWRPYFLVCEGIFLC